MSYQTGASSGLADLIDKVRLFAAANSWTIDFQGVSVGGVGWVHMHNADGNHVDLVVATTSYMYIISSTGYDAAQDCYNQPGRSARCRTDFLPSGFPNYFLFGDEHGFMCVTEISTAQFRHFGCGVLDKVGAYTGGFWITSSLGQTYQQYYNNFPFDGSPYYPHGQPGTEVRCDFEGHTWWTGLPPGNIGAPFAGEYRSEPRAVWSNRAGMEDTLYYRTPNTANALSILAPLRCMVERNFTGLYSLIGTVKDIRQVNINLLSPKDEVAYGGDTWKVFPVSIKGPESSGPYTQGTGNYGMAYKMVT